MSFADTLAPFFARGANRALKFAGAKQPMEQGVVSFSKQNLRAVDSKDGHSDNNKI